MAEKIPKLRLDIFNLNHKSFQTRFVKFLDNNPDIRRRYEYFADFMLSGGGRK